MARSMSAWPAARSTTSPPLAQWLRERYPAVQPSEEQRIWITFWSQSPHGARELARKIDVPV